MAYKFLISLKSLLEIILLVILGFWFLCLLSVAILYGLDNALRLLLTGFILLVEAVIVFLYCWGAFLSILVTYYIARNIIGKWWNRSSSDLFDEFLREFSALLRI